MSLILLLLVFAGLLGAGAFYAAKNSSISWKNLPAEFVAVAAQNPGTVTCALGAFAIGAVMIVDTRLVETTELWLMLGSLMLGIPLFLALQQLALIGIGNRALNLGLGIGALVLLYQSHEWSTPLVYIARWFQYLVVAHLLVSVAPFLKSESEAGVWKYNIFLLSGFIGSACYVLIGYVGIVIALLGTTYLFELTIPGEVYGILSIFALFVFHPVFFLSGLPDDPRELEKDTTYPGGIAFLVRFLLVPLITIYVAILLVYEGKILVTLTLPKGLVGWMICALGVSGMVTWLLAKPLTKEDSGWVRSYVRYFFWALLPLLGLLFFALWERVEAYGLTERRYFLGVLAVWQLGVALYFLFHPRPRIRNIPLSLMILALVTSVGPIGAFSIAEGSQVSRFRKFQQKHYELNRDPAKSADEIDKINCEASRIVEYLGQTHGQKGLAHLFIDTPSEEARAKIEQVLLASKSAFDEWLWSPRRGDQIKIYEDVLKLKDMSYVSRDCVSPDSRNYFSISKEYAPTALDVSQYNIYAGLLSVSDHDKKATAKAPGESEIEANLNGAKLIVTWEGKTIEFDLEPTILAKKNSSYVQLPAAEVKLSANSNGLTGLLQISNLHGHVSADNSIIISNFSFALLLGRK